MTETFSADQQNTEQGQGGNQDLYSQEQEFLSGSLNEAMKKIGEAVKEINESLKFLEDEVRRLTQSYVSGDEVNRETTYTLASNRLRILCAEMVDLGMSAIKVCENLGNSRVAQQTEEIEKEIRRVRYVLERISSFIDSTKSLLYIRCSSILLFKLEETYKTRYGEPETPIIQFLKSIDAPIQSGEIGIYELAESIIEKLDQTPNRPNPNLGGS